MSLEVACGRAKSWQAEGTIRSWRRDASKLRPRRGQIGAALLALTSVLILVSASLLIDRLTSLPARSLAKDRVAGESLREAKAAILGFGVSHPTTPGRLPYPDRRNDGNWDGIADCFNGGPNPGLRLGRLPWRGDVGGGQTGCAVEDDWRLDTASPLDRDDGLFYAVSGNLLFQSGASINWVLLDDPAPLYPWLTVRDADGAIISDQVAVVLIVPGEALQGAGGQDREWTGNQPPEPEEFLDEVTIGGTTYQNHDRDGCPDAVPTCGGGDGEEFIIQPLSSTFNDRLVFITAEDYLRAVEKRVVGDVAVALSTYRETYGAYPWLSPYLDPNQTTLGNALSGWANAPTLGNVMIDNDANFTAASPAGVNAGDIIENVSDGSTGTVFSVDSATQLTLAGMSGGATNSFSIGDGYNIRPVFNGRAGTREGQIPFIDSAGESFVFATDFTVEWSAASGISPSTPGPLAAIPAGFDANLAISAASLIEIGTQWVAAASGDNGPVSIGNSIQGTGDGVCEWTGNASEVVCRGSFVDAAPGYQVTATDVPTSTVYVFAVSRRYDFVLSYAGIASTGGDSNVKTRNVSSNSPLTAFPGPGVLTVEVNDTALAQGPYLDQLIFRVQLAPIPSETATFKVTGIYHDLDPGEADLPAYFQTHDWQRYVYARIAASNIQKAADVTGVAEVGSGGTTLEDADAGFIAQFVKVGDFIRNTQAGWQGFVSNVLDGTLVVGDTSRAPINGYATTASATVLQDASAEFIALSLEVNDSVSNDTDGSSALVQSVDSATQITLNGALSGGLNNTFAVGDSYSVTPNSGWVGSWSVGDSYEIWRWRCKSALPADASNPETDCLQVQVRDLSTVISGTPSIDARSDVRAVAVSAGPQIGAQNRVTVDVCGTEPDAICEYFEDVNAVTADDLVLQDVPITTFNDQLRIISATQ